VDWYVLRLIVGVTLLDQGIAASTTYEEPVTATGAAINAFKISRRCQLFIRITSKKSAPTLYPG